MSGKATTGLEPHAERAQCAISGRTTARKELIDIDTVRPSLAARIRQDHPGLADGALVSRDELAKYRSLYVQDLLREESGELSDIDQQVAESLMKHETLSENMRTDFRRTTHSASGSPTSWRSLAEAGRS